MLSSARHASLAPRSAGKNARLYSSKDGETAYEAPKRTRKTNDEFQSAKQIKEKSQLVPIFTHLSSKTHRPEMVDVSVKPIITRIATAQAIVKITDPLKALLQDKSYTSPKGPVFATAVIAGTMAAKKTSDLIPLCHPLSLSSCTIDVTVHGKEDLQLKDASSGKAIKVEIDEVAPYVKILATVRARERTGVEMEAMTAASVAALTIVDMCKSVVSSTELDILSVRVLEKHKIPDEGEPTSLLSNKNSKSVW